MKKQKKNYVVIALVVLLLALAVGYAAFSQTLTISGTVAGKATWDVKFTSVTLKDAEGKADTNHGTVTLAEDGKSATAEIKLSYPGDAVMLEAVVTNAGTVDAKLTNITVSGADDDIIITEAVPTAGEKLTANGGNCTAQYAIKWNADSEKTDIGTKTLKITYDYEQDTTEVNLTPEHK